MRNKIRKWLGITDLEAMVKRLLVDVADMPPEEAEKRIKGAVIPDYALLNNHGEEGQL